MSVTREYESSDFSEDFDEIERAVMESARGRWFLAEYAKRQRAEDTALILDAIHRLESVLMPAAYQAGALANPLVSEALDPAEITAEALRYYRQDEDVFAPLPGAKPDRPSFRVVGMADGTNPRVTIRRIAPDTTESASEPLAVTESQPPERIAPEVPPMREAQKPRIVLVRRASSELLSIPLANETPENAVA